jgi:hypothetical protein
VTTDLSGLSRDVLDDAGRLEDLIGLCLEESLGFAPKVWSRHRFTPQGVSLIGHGPRIRAAVHTWPELGVATFDVWSDVADIVTALEGVATSLTRIPSAGAGETSGGSRRDFRDRAALDDAFADVVRAEELGDERPCPKQIDGFAGK